MGKDKKDKDSVKKKYEEVKAKYKFPSFAEFDEAFELSKLYTNGSIIKEMRRAIIVKLQEYADLLEPILNPSQHTLADMILSQIFEKINKDEISKTYKHIWTLSYKSISAALANEKQEAEFINEAWKDCKKIKENMRKYVDLIVSSWQSQEKESTNTGYFS